MYQLCLLHSEFSREGVKAKINRWIMQLWKGFFFPCEVPRSGWASVAAGLREVLQQVEQDLGWSCSGWGGIGIGPDDLQPKSPSGSVCSLPAGLSAEGASSPAPGCSWSSWMMVIVSRHVVGWPSWGTGCTSWPWWAGWPEMAALGGGRLEVLATTNSFLTRDFRCLEKDSGWCICVGPCAHVICPRC